MRGKWNFLHHPGLTSRGGGGGGGTEFIILQLIEISTLWKIINLKKCFVWIFHFTFGHLPIPIIQNGRKWQAWKNQIEITTWSQFKVLMAIFFHKVYFTISKSLTISVLCFETMLVWSWTDKSSLGHTLLFTNVQLNWCIMVLLL